MPQATTSFATESADRLGSRIVLVACAAVAAKAAAQRCAFVARICLRKSAYDNASYTRSLPLRKRAPLAFFECAPTRTPFIKVHLCDRRAPFNSDVTPAKPISSQRYAPFKCVYETRDHTRGARDNRLA